MATETKSLGGPLKGTFFLQTLLSLATLCLPLTPVCSTAATLGSDSASNYTSSTWLKDSNQGTGFGAWDLWTGGNAGFYIGTPPSTMANLGNSFALYANFTAGDTNATPPTSGFTGFANAQRTFAGGPLSAGQGFKISLATGYRDGSKGIDLYDSNWNQLFNFSVSQDKYYAGGSELTWAYAENSLWNITATQVSSSQLQISVLRGSDAYTSSLINGSLNAFKLYASDVGGTEDVRNLFANNLQIIPEPSSLSLFALGATGLLALRRLRKST